MKKNDRIKEYLKEYLMFFVLYVLWYKILLYRNISFESSTIVSVIVFILICVLVIPGSILFMPRDELMMYFSLFNVLGIYTFIAYRNLREELCYRILFSIIIFSTLYLLYVFVKVKPNKNKRRRRRFLKKVSVGIVSVIAIHAIVLMLNIWITKESNYDTLVKANVKPEIYESSDIMKTKEYDEFKYAHV